MRPDVARGWMAALLALVGCSWLDPAQVPCAVDGDCPGELVCDAAAGRCADSVVPVDDDDDLDDDDVLDDDDSTDTGDDDTDSDDDDTPPVDDDDAGDDDVSDDDDDTPPWTPGSWSVGALIDFEPPGLVEPGHYAGGFVAFWRFDYTFGEGDEQWSCQRWMTLEGEGAFGFDITPDCLACTGQLTQAFGSLVTLAEPPSGWESDVLCPQPGEADQLDMAVEIFNPESAVGGDFAEILLVDRDALEDLGSTLLVEGQWTGLPGLVEAADGYFTEDDLGAAGYVDAGRPGSFAGQAGLEQGGGPAEPASSWLAYFVLGQPGAGLDWESSWPAVSGSWTLIGMHTVTFQ